MSRFILIIFSVTKCARCREVEAKECVPLDSLAFSYGKQFKRKDWGSAPNAMVNPGVLCDFWEQPNQRPNLP